MRAEVRGRGKKWKVFYEDEENIATPIPVYGRDGILKDTLYAGCPNDRMTESGHRPFRTADEATEYARWLGATEVKVTRTYSRGQALQKARTARRKKKTMRELTAARTAFAA